MNANDYTGPNGVTLVGLIADAETCNQDKYPAANRLGDLPVPVVWRCAAERRTAGRYAGRPTVRWAT